MVSLHKKIYSYVSKYGMLKHPRKIFFSAKISLHFLHTRERLLCRLWGSLWETINISICYCTRQSASVNKTKQLGGLCDISSVYFQRFGNGADLIFALSLLTSAQSALDVLRSNIDVGKGKDICYWGRLIKNIAATAALHKLPGKSSLNVRSVCPLCSFWFVKALHGSM